MSKEFIPIRSYQRLNIKIFWLYVLTLEFKIIKSFRLSYLTKLLKYFFLILLFEKKAAPIL